MLVSMSVHFVFHILYRIKKKLNLNLNHVGTLGRSFTRSCLWRFGMKLQHSICAVLGAPLCSSGLEEAL